MNKIAIIGAGPCGLSMLRAFEHAEQKEKRFQKLYVLKNKMIGEDYGTTVGELVQINMVILYPTVCIDIYGQMDQKNVWNLQIILLTSILENLFHLFHLEKYYTII